MEGTLKLSKGILSVPGGILSVCRGILRVSGSVLRMCDGVLRVSRLEVRLLERREAKRETYLNDTQEC